MLKFKFVIKRRFAEIGQGEFFLDPSMLPKQDKHVEGRGSRPADEVDRDTLMGWVLQMEQAINRVSQFRVHIECVNEGV